MKKYLFENANKKLEEIDNKLRNDYKYFNIFERIVLILIVLIYVINLLIIYFDSSYAIYLYDEMKDNFIASKFIEFTIYFNQSLMDSIELEKEKIVTFVNFLIFVTLILPFLIKGFIIENSSQQKVQ